MVVSYSIVFIYLILHFNRRFFFWVGVFDIFLIFFETFAADA